MPDEQSVFEFIKRRHEITIPELQAEFNIPYDEACALVENFVKKGKLTFKGGLTYVAESEGPDFGEYSPEDNLSKERERLDRRYRELKRRLEDPNISDDDFDAWKFSYRDDEEDKDDDAFRGGEEDKDDELFLDEDDDIDLDDDDDPYLGTLYGEGSPPEDDDDEDNLVDGPLKDLYVRLAAHRAERDLTLGKLKTVSKFRSFIRVEEVDDGWLLCASEGNPHDLANCIYLKHCKDGLYLSDGGAIDKLSENGERFLPQWATKSLNNILEEFAIFKDGTEYRSAFIDDDERLMYMRFHAGLECMRMLCEQSAEMENNFPDEYGKWLDILSGLIKTCNTKEECINAAEAERKNMAAKCDFKEEYYYFKLVREVGNMSDDEYSECRRILNEE